MKRLLFCVAAAALMLAGCQHSTPESTQAATVPPAPASITVPATEVPTTAAPETEPPTTAATVPYIEVFREGEGTQIPVEIVRGTVGSYTIAMDPEYFTFKPQETVDLFSYDAWEDSPGVFYAISDYRDDADLQKFLSDTVQQFSPLFGSCSTEETTVGGYPATAVYLSEFTMDTAYQYHIFLVNCDGNYYLIEASFVMEMHEGLYAIMRSCFDTLSPAP